MEATTVIAQFTERAQDDVESAERDVLRQVANLRRDLDQIESALQNGHVTPASVSGTPFVASTARDLADALRRRDQAYRDVATFTGIAKRMEA